MIVNYYDLDRHINEHNRWAYRDTDIWLTDAPDVCPFCGNRLIIIDQQELITKLSLEDYVEDRNRADQPIYSLKLRLCEKCSWWHIYRYLYDTEYYDLNQITVIRAIIKRFDITGQDIAISELGKYLTSKIDAIYNIHHKKMEELVGDVLKDHFHCEVTYCGSSHDRGIDLILVQGDQLIPVQVKRRMKKGATESVRVVREMLGVMLRDEKKRSIIVSSADKFSYAAINEVNEVREKLLVDNIELINIDNLHSIMKNHFGEVALDPWRVVKKICTP